MSAQHKVQPAGDLVFTQPLAIRGRNGGAVLRSVNQAIDWIDARRRRQIPDRMREIAWRLRDAHHVRSQKDADDASDRLAHALATLGVLKR